MILVRGFDDQSTAHPIRSDDSGTAQGPEPMKMVPFLSSSSSTVRRGPQTGWVSHVRLSSVEFRLRMVFRRNFATGCATAHIVLTWNTERAIRRVAVGEI